MNRIRHLALLAFVLVLTPTLRGQAGTTGTVLGMVTDTTGAVIANAPVDVTNTETGVTTRVKSTGTGDYTATNLIPGTYRISVQMPGFSKAVVGGIVLAVAQDARVNVLMKPGATSETVEVSASAVALDTDSSAVSQIVTNCHSPADVGSAIGRPQFHGPSVCGRGCCADSGGTRPDAAERRRRDQHQRRAS